MVRQFKPYRPKHTLYFSKGLLNQYDNSGEETVTDLVNMEIEISKAKKREGCSMICPKDETEVYLASQEILLAAEPWLLMINTMGDAQLFNGDGTRKNVFYINESFAANFLSGLFNPQIVVASRYIYIIYSGNKVARIDSKGYVKVNDATVQLDVVDVSNEQLEAPYFIKTKDGYPIVGDIRIGHLNNAGYISKLSKPSYISEMERGFVSVIDGNIIDSDGVSNVEAYGIATHEDNITNRLRAYYDPTITVQDYVVSDSYSPERTAVSASDDDSDKGVIFALRPDGQVDVYSSVTTDKMCAFKSYQVIGSSANDEGGVIVDFRKDSLPTPIEFVINQNLSISGTSAYRFFLPFNLIKYNILQHDILSPLLRDCVHLTGYDASKNEMHPVTYNKIFTAKYTLKPNTSYKLREMLKNLKSNKAVVYSPDIIARSPNRYGYFMYFSQEAIVYDSLIYVDNWIEDTAYTFDAVKSGYAYEHNFFDTWQIKNLTSFTYGFKPDTLELTADYTNKDGKTVFIPKNQQFSTEKKRFAVWNNNKILAKSQKYFSSETSSLSTREDSIVYTLGNDAITSMKSVPICSMEGSLLRQFPYEHREVKLMNNVEKAVLNNGVLFVVDSGELWLSDEGMVLQSKVNIPDSILDIAAIADGVLLFTNRNVYKVDSKGQSMLVLGGMPCHYCKAITGGVVAVSTNNKIHLYTAKYTDNNFFQVEMQDLSILINDVIFPPDSRITATNDTIFISNDRNVYGYSNGGWTKHYNFLYKIRDIYSFNNKLVIHFFQEIDMWRFFPIIGLEEQ